MLQFWEYVNNANLYEAGQSHVKVRAAPRHFPPIIPQSPAYAIIPFPVFRSNPDVALLHAKVCVPYPIMNEREEPHEKILTASNTPYYCTIHRAY